VYAVERQQDIAELVAQRGRLSVNALAEQYGVTTETVRRDLDVLERAGLIRRVHGGAVRTETVSALELALNDRARENPLEKDQIAEEAVRFLPGDGGSVILDSGSSTGRLAVALPSDRSLTLLTNSVPIAARLAGSPAITLHMLPGRVRPATQAAVGEDLVAALSTVRVDVAFMGTNGISMTHGLSTPDHSEAAAKRAMIAAARRIVVLADFSKFGVETTVRFAELDQADCIVTDAAAPEKSVAALRERGIDVVVAGAARNGRKAG
jgi:DeoR family fructose operon transcriptional repressor